MNTVVQDKLPVYSFKQIFQLRDRLAGALIPHYAHLTIGDGDDLKLVVDEIREIMPESVPRIAINETTRQLLGQRLDEAAWKDFCWRLAGNITTLKQGRPVEPWRAPGLREWVPLQILRIDPSRSFNNDQQFDLTFRALAGTPAAMQLKKVFSSRWLGTLSGFLGFSNRYGDRPYISPYQLASLRFFALFDPELVKFDQPNFFEVRCGGQCEEHNRKILGLRYRLQGEVCPQNFLHTCHQCAVGYLTCPAGTHKDDYFSAVCQQCKQNAWFDPGSSKDMCIDCWRTKITTP